MYILIIIIIISFIIGIYIAKREHGDLVMDYQDIFICTLFGSIIATIPFCCLSFIFFVVSCSFSGADTVTRLTLTENIVAIKDTQQVEGSFGGGVFMWSGYIEGELYYYAYRENADNTYSMITVNPDITRIMEDNTTPRIETFETCPDEKSQNKAKWLIMNMSCNEEKVIHVPAGTIIQEMKLDLE